MLRSVSVDRNALRALAVATLVVATLAGCATGRRAPVEDRTARPASPAATAQQAAPAPAGTPAQATAEGGARAPTYTVKRGDTLHGIALDHGLDYRDLAAWNNIGNANRIEVGQVLLLAAPGASAATAAGTTTAPLKSAPAVVAQGATGTAQAPPGNAGAAVPAGARNTDNYKSQPKLFKEPYSEQALRDAQRLAGMTAASEVVAAASPASASGAPPAVASTTAQTAAPTNVATAESAPAKNDQKPESKPEPKPEPRAPASSNAPADDDHLQWTWPANGKIVAGDSESAALKGIDIAGAAGSPVVASAAGKVVYAGSAIRGYGKLIIVKHNATYLSAYGHNREILVKEGQQVARGQKIAEMGNTDANDVRLHFEIRRLGKPVDPLKFLPPA